MPGIEVIASSLVSGFLLGGILALTALGLSIVLGVMRLVNLAHGEFLIAGAYTALFLLTHAGVDPLIGLLPIGLLLACIAFPIQRYLLMPLSGGEPEAPMMTTFGISIILQNVFVLLFSGDTRSIDRSYATASLTVGPVTVAWIYIIGFVISVTILLAVHYLVSSTAYGRDLRASAADPKAASAIGVNVRQLHALTFALGAACAGMGGTLIGLAFSFTPTSGATYLLNDFAIIVLGGLGNIMGTLIGGITLGLLQSIGGIVLGDGYRDLVSLVVFLIVLAIRPQGMLSGSTS